MGTDGKGTRLDLDVVTAWVASNAGRWNVTDPVAALPADAGGAQIRDAATNAVAGIAAAMTGTEKTPATEHDRRAAEIAEWLADCLNETASGAEDGPPEDACEPLATSGGRGCTPTRRWAAALREHAQHVEIGWRRPRVHRETDGRALDDHRARRHDVGRRASRRDYPGSRLGSDADRGGRGKDSEQPGERRGRAARTCCFWPESCGASPPCFS